MLFRRQPVPIVSLGTGTTLLAKDVLLDVRDEAEFLEGHVPDAWFCPVAELESIRWDLPMNLRIVCLSRTGDRGHAATDQLRQWGFNAANLEGGMLAWHDDGRPIVREDGTPGQVRPSTPSDDGRPIVREDGTPGQVQGDGGPGRGEVTGG
ncbi:MAG TPA: rhodanese-like domain-containing protein [Acidimicrobiia bacterium]